jgi:hypothetical protein
LDPCAREGSRVAWYCAKHFLQPLPDMILEGYSLGKGRGLEEQIEVRFLPGSGKDFGPVVPVSLTLQRPALVITNVQPFPWIEMWVNGHLQRKSDLIAIGANNRVAARERPAYWR